MTKKYRSLEIIFWFIILLINTAPMGTYIVKGFIEGEQADKVKLSILTIAAIICLIINVLTKLHPRCALWVLLFGVSQVLENIELLIAIMAITTLLDEAILTPLYKYFKQKRIINAEIDKR